MFGQDNNPVKTKVQEANAVGQLGKKVATKAAGRTPSKHPQHEGAIMSPASKSSVTPPNVPDIS